jgi:molybdopterin converting factor small subunit
MSVTVQVPTILRQYTGGEKEVDAAGATVAEVFAHLDGRFPGIGEQLVTGDGELHRFVNVYLDDEDIRYLDKLDTKVADGAVIAVLPAVAGGVR